MTTLETKPTSQERDAIRRTRAPRLGRSASTSIWAIFKRNFLSYFSNPAGYVFITLFVFISSCVAFWQASSSPTTWRTWTSSTGTCRTCSFLHPGDHHELVGRRAAAGDRRAAPDAARARPGRRPGQVPGGPRDLHGGPALLAHRTSSMLTLLGEPDLGVMFVTYLGYWLMGVLLIAVGMVASLLSSNVTVAFILGARFFLRDLPRNSSSGTGFGSPDSEPRLCGGRIEELVGPVAVPGFRHWRDHALGALLFPRARRGDALPEHGAAGPAALGRRRGEQRPLAPFARFGSWRCCSALFSRRRDGRARWASAPTSARRSCTHSRASRSTWSSRFPTTGRS